jgi:hypothetical protein
MRRCCIVLCVGVEEVVKRLGGEVWSVWSVAGIPLVHGRIGEKVRHFVASAQGVSEFIRVELP